MWSILCQVCGKNVWPRVHSQFYLRKAQFRVLQDSQETTTFLVVEVIVCKTEAQKFVFETEVKFYGIFLEWFLLDDHKTSLFVFC